MAAEGGGGPRARRPRSTRTTASTRRSGASTWTSSRPRRASGPSRGSGRSTSGPGPASSRSCSRAPAPASSRPTSSPRAVACAQRERRAARLADRVEVDVLEADLFPGRRASTSSSRTRPGSRTRRARRSSAPSTIPAARSSSGSCSGLPGRLAPGGEAWIVISDLAELLGLRPPGTSRRSPRAPGCASRTCARRGRRTRARGTGTIRSTPSARGEGTRLFRLVARLSASSGGAGVRARRARRRGGSARGERAARHGGPRAPAPARAAGSAARARSAGARRLHPPEHVVHAGAAASGAARGRSRAGT